METVATSPGYEPIFRLWIKHTREQMGARPLGSLVSLRKTLIGFEQSRWGELAQHLEALKALVTNEEALDRMLAALKWAQARGKGEAPPSQREDAAALLTEILRHAKASGVCVICLQTQARRFLQCRRCGFRTGAPKA